MFDAASVDALDFAARRTGESLESAETSAAALDQAASWYVSGVRMAARSRAGEAARFAGTLRRQCDAALESLGARAGSAEIGVSAPLDPLVVLVRHPGPRTAAADYALSRFCRRTLDWDDRDGERRPDLWGALQTAVDGLRYLAVVAATAEQSYAAKKEKKGSDEAVLNFVRALSQIYERRFGVRAGKGSPGDSQSGYGPGNRFIQAAIRHAIERIPVVFDSVPERDADLLPKLRDISESPSKIRDRLRDRAAPTGIRKRDGGAERGRPRVSRGG